MSPSAYGFETAEDRQRKKMEAEEACVALRARWQSGVDAVFKDWCTTGARARTSAIRVDFRPATTLDIRMSEPHIRVWHQGGLSADWRRRYCDDLSALGRVINEQTDVPVVVDFSDTFELWDRNKGKYGSDPR